MPKNCPRCGLVHANSAARCDCGTELTTAVVLPDDPAPPVGADPLGDWMRRAAERGAARRLVHAAGLVTLAALALFPPMALVQTVSVHSSENPIIGQSQVQVIARLGHRGVWDAGYRIPSVRMPCSQMSWSGLTPHSLTFENVHVHVDRTTLVAEAGLVVAAWALLLAVVPRHSPAPPVEPGRQP